jgi:Leucine-rich repeat (LRR) protein
MKKLKCLDISKNTLKTLPDLSKCTTLAKLDISYNPIEELPAYLSELSIDSSTSKNAPSEKSSA